MIELNIKPEHKAEYERLENDLIYKESIGVLTIAEESWILDTWLRERGY